MQRGKRNFRLKPANSVVIKLCQYLRAGEYLFKAISCYTTVEEIESESTSNNLGNFRYSFQLLFCIVLQSQKCYYQIVKNLNH